MSTAEAVSVEVPDIGDFDDIPIIEILVSPGDRVAVDDPLLTLESDKATMDVPAPFAGTVGDLHVKVGDKVSQGTLLLTIEPSSAGDMARPSKAALIASEGAPSEAAAPTPIASALEADGPLPPARPRPHRRSMPPTARCTPVPRSGAAHASSASTLMP